MRHLYVIEEMLMVDVFDLDIHKIVAYGLYMPNQVIVAHV